MKKRYKKMTIVKSQAENEMEKEAIRKIEEKIYREIPTPPEPQKKIDDFIPKDTNYWHKYNEAKTLNPKKMKFC